MAWGYRGDKIMRIKKAVRIITVNKYNSHTEPFLIKSRKYLKGAGIKILL